ncbi:TBC1 domain member 31 [Chytriomyces hyalinus]|nr:TBC1 domain member 31 [Chytriomyces hyalinus]
MSLPPRTLFVGESKTADLWRVSEWRKIVAGMVSAGSLLRVLNAASVDGTHVVRPVPFTCVASSAEMPINVNINTTSNLPQSASADSSFNPIFAYVLAAVDQRGHVFAFDIPKNKFWLVARSGVSAVCMTFNSVRRREIILGLSDNSIHCYNIDTNLLVARLPAYHKSAPLAISVHPTLPLAISNSSTESILWDTEKWERKRVLMGAGPGVQQASFSKTGDAIVTAFNDGSILIWDTFTVNLRWKISLDRFAANLEQQPPGHSLSGNDKNSRTHFHVYQSRTSYFSTSANDEYLVYGGIDSSVTVWNLIEKRLVHEIVIPDFKKRIISQIEFLGNSNVIAVLSSAGQLVLIDVEKAKMLGQFKGKHLFRSFSVSHDGSVMTVVLMDVKYSLRLIRVDHMFRAGKEKREEREDEDEGETAEDLHQRSPPSSPIKKVKVQPPQTKTFYEMIEAKENTTLLNRRKLLKYLKHYGSYPDDYRTMIWRFLLKLPENRDAYEILLEKGIHSSVKDFRKKFPLKSDRIAKSMERTLSCLAHWSPIFEDLDYLPGMVFPIVKLFVNDMFSGFEVIMTILLNWCQKWWEYYPNPPIECLAIIEDLLKLHDPQLLSHFVHLQITSQVYAWPLLQTLLTEILSKSEWLRVWDHLVTNPPAFLYYIVASYLIQLRVSLLDATKLQDIAFTLSRVNGGVSVDKLVVAAYRMHSETPDSASPVTFFEAFKPVLRGQYPIFNAYPEFIVNYQSKMKERIRTDEIEYLRRRKLADEVSKLSDELKKDKQAWESADWKMNEMVETWWESMMGAEDSHNERLARLDAQEKEQRVRALKRIAEARKSFVQLQANNTHAHALNLAKAVGSNRNTLETQTDLETLDTQFKRVENEWMARKEEMLAARQELSKLDQTRAERFVWNAKRVGVPPETANSMGTAAMDATDEYISHAFQTERLRAARSEGLRDPSLSPTRIKPRAWSPALLGQSRHRRMEVDASEYNSDGTGVSPVRSELSVNVDRYSEGSPTRSVRFDV